MSSYNPTPWSVDITAKAQYHLSFLKTVDSLPALHQIPHLQNAVRRYELMWLPLLARNPGESLEPPIDVHWIWHCHLLCPIGYAKDCEQLLGSIPDHELRILKTPFEEATTKAKFLWEQNFPQEPFYIDFNAVPSTAGAAHRSALSYDLVAAAQRQRSFYYNVSLPHYTDTKFLSTAADRYAKFLNLKRNNVHEFVVPMYDVDLMWHTHQLYPHAYRKDTLLLLGFVLNHDDDTERSPGSKLATSDAATRVLWKQTYGEEFPIPGALYRGESPVGKLFTGQLLELKEDVPVIGEMKIDQVIFTGGKDKYRVSASLSTPHGSHVNLQQQKGSPITWSSTNKAGGLMLVKVATKQNFAIKGKFTRRDGFQGSLFGKDICKMYVNTNDYLKGLKPSPESVTRSLRLESGEYSMEIQASLNLKADSQMMTIKWGSFADYTMPEDIEQLWGPVQFPRLPQGVANTCRVASHLIQLNKQTVFTVRVIHSLPLRMSVIQVFYKDKLTVSSQLVGTEQLPTPDQISLGRLNPTLDGKNGQRAMLIKNSKGDWGVVTGKWTGFKRGDRRSAGNPGHLEVAITCLGDNLTHAQRHTFTLMKSQYGGRISTRSDHINSLKSSMFNRQGISVSMAENKVEVGADCTEVPEMLAATFSGAVLLLLCEPQPQLFLNKGKPSKPVPMKRGSSSVNKYNSHDVPFFFYCGYMEPIYSNSWLYWYHVSHIHDHHYDHGDYDGCVDSEMNGTDGTDVTGGMDGDSPQCPWDPEGTMDHSNDATIAESGCDIGGTDSGAVCGGCGSCGASCGGSGGTGGGCGATSSGCGATSSGCGSSCGSSCGGGCGGGGCGG